MKRKAKKTVKKPIKTAKKTKSSQKPTQKPNKKPVVKTTGENNAKKVEFPDTFPFWARLKISKNRTTLVIDEERSLNKRNNKVEDMFVHREATSKYKKDRLEIKPNPDKDKKDEPMYLKGPTKLPVYLFVPHNKTMDIPKELVEKYSKNNKKK